MPINVDESRLTDLEREVLDKLLAGDDPILATLRDQLVSCRVSSRKFTGVGFLAGLEVERSALPALAAKSPIQGVGADVSGLRMGASFHVVVEDGYLHLLEGYAYGDEQWPEEKATFVVRYEDYTTIIQTEDEPTVFETKMGTDRRLNIPTVIGGGRVLYYTRIDERHTPREAANELPYGLAVCDLEGSGVHLFTCEDDWMPVFDTCHATADDAKSQAALEFEGVASTWEQPPQ